MVAAMKHFDIIAFSGIVALLVVVAVYMVRTPPIIATPPLADQSTGLTFATFCRSARLVPKAVADCQEMMAAAKTDADRIRVERTFAMSGITVGQPAASPPGP